MAKAIIATNGNFPAEYNVLQANKDGIYEVVFGPDPDLADAQRKADELNGVRARDKKGHNEADNPSEPELNEADVGGKATKQKAKEKRKTKE